MHFHLEKSTVTVPSAKTPTRPSTISNNIRRATISLVTPSTESSSSAASTSSFINTPFISTKPTMIRPITTTNAPTNIIYHSGRIHVNSFPLQSVVSVHKAIMPRGCQKQQEKKENNNCTRTEISRTTDPQKNILIGKSSSASNSLVISQGKSKEALDSLHISQRTIKVGNIPQDLFIQQLENLFTDNQIEGIESIHIPVDNLGFQFGFLFITFNSRQYFEDFCSKIDGNSKFLYITERKYNGPFIVQPHELPDCNLNNQQEIEYNCILKN
ncbi:unnamed protein product [Rotaria sp. Silwood2]|nr:unnamed protein product [Rotaria sp. Silwood2]CAF4453176.1 unnamed protein product [Rotaria sp. Silwood2]